MKKVDTPPNYKAILKEIANPLAVMKLLQAVSANIQEFNQYYHWEELKYRETPNGFSREEWWTVLKMRRHSVERSTVVPYNGGLNFWWTMPDELVEMLHQIDVQSGIVVNVDEKQVIDAASTAYLRETSPLFEAVTSSQLEGAPTTWADAKEMVRVGRSPRDVGERMILNNYKAMQLIVQHHDEDLTPSFILELHRILTDMTLEKEDAAGRYRLADEFVRVADMEGTIFHLPPPADGLPDAMEQLCRFANRKDADGRYVPDIVRAIILHFWMAFEHPFVDGNGRVARALMYWSLLRSGYSIFEFVSISNILKKAPSRYVRAFLYAETDEGDLTYFILHQVDAILQAIAAFKEYTARKADKLKKSERTLLNLGFPSRLRGLLAYSLHHPKSVLTIAACQRMTGVSYATARGDLLDLARRGLLEMHKEGRAFCYYPVSDLEERLAVASQGRNSVGCRSIVP